MKRLNIFKELLTREKLDAILVSSPHTINYLLNFHRFSTEERDAFLLVTKKNHHIITSALYADAFSSSNISVQKTSGERGFSELINEIKRHEEIRSIGIEEYDLKATEWKKLKKSVGNLKAVSLFDVRLKKDRQEIDLIKNACKIADNALKIILPKIKPGLSEIEVAKILESEVQKQRADISFPTIVAFGKNSAIPHHLTGNTKLKSNDTILIDFGAKYESYCSDMTRTFFIGKPTAEQQEVYKAVLKSQNEAIKLLRHKLAYDIHKIKASDIDKVSRTYILSKGYPTIPHSLGHGIGLQVHEAPSLSPSSEYELEDGMVFSIEPGIYLPTSRQVSQGFGIRIEDLFVIQKRKLVQLTSSSKTQFILKTVS